MTTDELADRVEAGLRAGLDCCHELLDDGYPAKKFVTTPITDALAALADYRKRVAALEAFVKRVNDIAPKEHMDWFTSDEEVLFELGKQARALLAGSEGGGRLPDVSGVWWTLTAADQAEMLAIASGQQPADVSKTLLIRNMVYFDDLNKFGITDYGKRVMAGSEGGDGQR